MNDSKITELLKAAYAAELETVENYLANSIWLDGIGAREVSESLDAEINEELTRLMGLLLAAMSVQFAFTALPKHPFLIYERRVPD